MQVAVLFRDHRDLLEEFTHFLPDTSAVIQGQHGSDRNSLMRVSMSITKPIHTKKALIAFFFCSAVFLYVHLPADVCAFSLLQKDQDFNIDGSDADNDNMVKAEREQRRLDKERYKRDGINRLECDLLMRSLVGFIWIVCFVTMRYILSEVKTLLLTKVLKTMDHVVLLAPVMIKVF